MILRPGKKNFENIEKGFVYKKKDLETHKRANKA
jgi:hypothetical protein